MADCSSAAVLSRFLGTACKLYSALLVFNQDSIASTLLGAPVVAFEFDIVFRVDRGEHGVVTAICESAGRRAAGSCG